MDYPNTVLNYWGKPFALINFDEDENLNLIVLEQKAKRHKRARTLHVLKFP